MQIENIKQAQNVLIYNGVKNLRESFAGVDEDNILTDRMYIAFFKQSLEMTLEDLPQRPHLDVNIKVVSLYKNAIKILLAAIAKNVNLNNEE
jgi:hypothetical protein